MAKTKTRDISITASGGAFSILKKFTGSKPEYDFSGIQALRHLLSNERARILNVIKNKKPGSIYHLAKLLKRDFKSVRDDVKLLERFGFIELISEKSGKREKLKPVLVVDSIKINIAF